MRLIIIILFVTFRRVCINNIFLITCDPLTTAATPLTACKRLLMFITCLSGFFYYNERVVVFFFLISYSLFSLSCSANTWSLLRQYKYYILKISFSLFIFFSLLLSSSYDLPCDRGGRAFTFGSWLIASIKWNRTYIWPTTEIYYALQNYIQDSAYTKRVAFVCVLKR